MTARLQNARGSLLETDLLCVVQKRVFSQYVSQVGRGCYEDGPMSLVVIGLGRSKSGRLTLLQSQLADARADLASITEVLSIRAATARVRRWKKWAQSVVSDQRKPPFQWAKGRDLVPLPIPVLVDGEMRADAQVLVDEEFGNASGATTQCAIWLLVETSSQCRDQE